MKDLILDSILGPQNVFVIFLLLSNLKDLNLVLDLILVCLGQNFPSPTKKTIFFKGGVGGVGGWRVVLLVDVRHG